MGFFWFTKNVYLDDRGKLLNHFIFGFLTLQKMKLYFIVNEAKGDQFHFFMYVEAIYIAFEQYTLKVICIVPKYLFFLADSM